MTDIPTTAKIDDFFELKHCAFCGQMTGYYSYKYGAYICVDCLGKIEGYSQVPEIKDDYKT